MDYIVYKYTSPSGKSYIGMTCQGLERRSRNGRGYAGCTLFYKAILKYGWDAFKHEILESGLTYEQACEKEKEYISKFRTLSTQNGYNLEDGGNANHKMSEESKKKMALAQKGKKKKPLSDEQKLKLSLAHKGKKRPPRGEEYRKRLSESRKGKTFSEEHCRHISESKKGVYAGKNNPRARKVLCIETGVIFDTIKDAGEFIGGSPKNIVTCCRGRLKTSGGYHWRYADEEVSV